MAYTTINDPSAHFQTKVFTGDGNDNRAITNDGNSNLQPDWIWFKNRSTTNSHNLLDSSRGITKKLEGTNNTNAEGTTSTRLTSFDTDGFTVRTDPSVNGNGNNIVAWQWKANGGTTASNSDGSVASTVQVNNTAGFSIVTYSGDGNGNFTVGHGLNSAPDFLVVKRRGSTSNWYAWHKHLTSGSYVFYLNATNAQASEGTIWNGTAPTSSVFTIGTDANIKASDTYVAYCFTSIKGYSKFGTYTGNASADGQFVYTGFKPAWLMTKRISGSGQWSINDIPRHPFNVLDRTLLANQDSAETTSSNYSTDFLSNGFKLRTADDAVNDGTYVYLAFAEQPFVATNNAVATAF